MRGGKVGSVMGRRLEGKRRGRGVESKGSINILNSIVVVFV